jgi:hypothetical protein
MVTYIIMMSLLITQSLLVEAILMVLMRAHPLVWLLPGTTATAKYIRCWYHTYSVTVSAQAHIVVTSTHIVSIQLLSNGHGQRLC